MSSVDLNTVHLDQYVYHRSHSDLDPYRFEEIELVDGVKIIRVHPFIKCMGRHCTIHNPSEHPLYLRPLHWRDDKGIFERICEHDIGHDDPDDVAYRRSLPGVNTEYIGIHGCDGCCAGKYKEAQDGGGWIAGADYLTLLTGELGVKMEVYPEDNAKYQTIRDQLQELRDGAVRTFESGATRDVEDHKNDYEGFLNPLVIRAFGDYMHHHRIQSDGNLRPSDNWQRGMGQKAYMKSMWRHFHDVWTIHRGYDAVDFNGESVDQVEALCALMFNVQGMLYEVLKDRQ